MGDAGDIPDLCNHFRGISIEGMEEVSSQLSHMVRISPTLQRKVIFYARSAGSRPDILQIYIYLLSEFAPPVTIRTWRDLATQNE